VGWLVSNSVETSTAGNQLVQLGSCSEKGNSQRRREAVNTKVMGSEALEAVTRQRLVKTRKTDLVRSELQSV
jgi:hypothetical protein